MTLEEYLGDWMKVIDRQELYKVLNTLGAVYTKKPVCPEQPDVFAAFGACKYNDLKVVFLGQDPYPQKGVATGILFGNKEDVEEDKLSPSLKIVKEAAINFEIPHNSVTFDNTLRTWANQGILMINSALTCEMNRVGSHVMLWRPFIAKLLKNLSDRETGIIYVLFGSQAQTFTPYINSKTNTVIKVEHPAWYARVGKKMSSQLFLDINKVLKEKYGKGITWYQEFNYKEDLYEEDLFGEDW